MNLGIDLGSAFDAPLENTSDENDPLGRPINRAQSLWLLTNKEITILRDSPSWLQNALTILSGFARLPDGWDGADSPGLNKTLQRSINSLLSSLNTGNKLEPPLISPVPGGGIQLEWEHRNRELLIEFSADCRTTKILAVDELDNQTVYSRGRMSISDFRAVVAFLLK